MSYHSAFVKKLETDDKVTDESLREAVADYAEFVRSEDYNGDRAEKYTNDIFEKAVTLYLGEQFWAEIRAAQDRAEGGEEE